MLIKIAAVTEDGEHLSSHFGMAPTYQVFSVDGERVVAKEERAKPHHEKHPDHNHEGHEGHEHGPGHGDMFAPIADCKVLLVGGMGQPAFQKAKAVGLEVVLAGGPIQATLEAYLKGEIRSDARRVHLK